jgi:D-alanyl-lipoteichoic acid acyltransferase DltB (MBOAT superfamily)
MTLASFAFVLFLLATYVAWRFGARSPEARRVVLLAASYIFYCTWDVRFAIVLAITTTVQWWIGHRIEASVSEAGRKAWLRASLAYGLGTLMYFKYMGFFVEQLQGLLAVLGANPSTLSVATIIAPVGISFYTFQSLSYTIDIRHRREKPTDLLSFALFLGFFASVTSGPISRARLLVPQIEASNRDTDRLPAEALFLMLRGLVKKVAFADVLAAQFVDPAFADPGAWSRGFLVVAIVAYSFQIYMDLSGYTDMARGAARCFGYDLALNFNRPYLARTVSNFWQRWHMSMSGFFRDYFYFALGGSKRGNVYVNLMLTFVGIGIWHGAGWNFVVYGFLQGAAVCFERWRRTSRAARGLPPPAGEGLLSAGVGILTTFAFVSFVRVLFVSDDLGSAVHYVQSMFFGTGAGGSAGPQGYATLLLAIALHLVPQGIEMQARALFLRLPIVVQSGLICALMYALVVLAAAPRPFVYFQF